MCHWHLFIWPLDHHMTLPWSLPNLNFSSLQLKKCSVVVVGGWANSLQTLAQGHFLDPDPEFDNFHWPRKVSMNPVIQQTALPIFQPSWAAATASTGIPSPATRSSHTVRLISSKLKSVLSWNMRIYKYLTVKKTPILWRDIMFLAGGKQDFIAAPLPLGLLIGSRTYYRIWLGLVPGGWSLKTGRAWQ